MQVNFAETAAYSQFKTHYSATTAKSGYSPHGLRHLAGAALAEAGATMDEIMAILGHLTEDEAHGYVQNARRKVMARSAMDKWEAKGRKEEGA
jgi:integrase